jgi:hypothetical protein
MDPLPGSVRAQVLRGTPDPDAFERWVEEANLGVVLLPTSARSSERLSTYLEHSPRWNLAYRDPRAQVYLPQ